MSELTVLEAYSVALDQAAPVQLHYSDGLIERHDASRWLADADAVDRRMLARCDGPTVDLGCGPGRLVVALAACAVTALGVDVSARAVELARARGAVAIRRNLFSRLPGEGRWACALLADGNIGIGGSPPRLLRRVHDLVAPGGLLVVEVRREDCDRRGRARLVSVDGVVSGPFAWASVGAPALRRAAAGNGWTPLEQWDDADRRFLTLQR